MDTYEIVIRGRLSPALIDATRADSATFAAGVTALVADHCDQTRLFSLLKLLRDINAPLVSVNAMETATAQG
jgi:hypothetical protein